MRNWDMGSYVNGPEWYDAFHSGLANVTMVPHYGVDAATHVPWQFQRYPGSPLYQTPDRGSRGRDSVQTPDVAAPPSPIEPRTPEPEATNSFERSATPKTEPSEVDYMPGVGSRMTVMLRNLPNNYSRSMLLELLDSEGFAGRYDFVYLPMDFKSRASLGYAFVNLVSACEANPFWKHFDGFSRWVLPSQKVCSVNWSSPYQGLEAHVERYRNSPVMHDAVPDEYKPMLFRNGVRIAFPPPTRKLRAPRSRPGRNCIA